MDGMVSGEGQGEVLADAVRAMFCHAACFGMRAATQKITGRPRPWKESADLAAQWAGEIMRLAGAESAEWLKMTLGVSGSADEVCRGQGLK